MVWASGNDAHSLGRCSRHDQVGGDRREDPGLGGEIKSQDWPGNASGSPRQSCSMWPGNGKSGAPCLSCYPHDPTPDKRITMTTMSMMMMMMMKIDDLF